MQSIGHLEVGVVLGHGTLLLDVLRNHLISHVTTRRYEIASCPKVPTPELLGYPPKFAHQMMRRFPLDCLHNSARRYVRRRAKQQVNVIRSNMTLNGVHRQTDFSDQLTKS